MLLISSYSCLIFSCSQSVCIFCLQRRTPPKTTWKVTLILICVKVHLISNNFKWTQIKEKVIIKFVKETLKLHTHSFSGWRPNAPSEHWPPIFMYKQLFTEFQPAFYKSNCLILEGEYETHPLLCDCDYAAVSE